MKTQIKLTLTAFFLLLTFNKVLSQHTARKSVFQYVNASTPFDSAAFFKTFRSGYKMANGIKMHYVIGGTGKLVVVLVHGFPSDWYSWRKIMPVLAKEYTVIAPDLRGLGLSDKPKTGYSKKNLAKDVHDLVHTLGYSQIYIAGYDFGGPISYAYAAQYTDEVKKLVISECGGMAGYGLEKLMDVTHGGLWHFGFFMTPQIPELLITGKERPFFSAFGWGPVVKEKSAFTQTDINHYLNNLSAPGGLNGLFEYYRSYPQDVKDNHEFAKTKITIPILAIDGLTAGKTKKAMQQLATNISGQVIVGGGHWLPEERPNDFLTQLLPFFHKP